MSTKAEPTDPDELYRYNERLAICLDNGVPYERAVRTRFAQKASPAVCFYCHLLTT